MEKTLTTIQKLAKIGKVLSRIVFICCIVGVIGCAVGIVSLAVGFVGSIELGGVTVHGLIETSAEMSIGSMYASMTVGLILCAGELALAKMAEHYFQNELKAGTPFTLSGAKELLRLGIYTICIPIGTMILADIAYQVLNHSFEQVADMHIDNYASVGLGIAFIVVSVLCKYGAEISDKAVGNADITA